MDVIKVEHLTQDFGRGHGIFDVNFTVAKGETLGFLGPNGAGKSTTMRHLMGFTNPQKGSASILGMDCHKEYYKIMEHVGYLPGEVAIADGLTGKEFLGITQQMKKTNDNERLKYLIEKFELNADAKVKRMSIGEKRKLAIVAAFLADSDVLLLDEPTSGLDPIMQEVFVSFIKEEKRRGKTILLSSHIFTEVEALCDRIAIIKDGEVVAVVNAAEVKNSQRKTFEIYFADDSSYGRFQNEKYEIVEKNDSKLMAAIIFEKEIVNDFLKTIRGYKAAGFIERKITLEQYFMKFYKDSRIDGGLTKCKVK